MDGTPFVLLMPTVFFQFLEAADDYYERILASFLRQLRLIAIILSLFLPPTYIAMTTYHQEMIPFTMLISIAVSREGVPFPVFIEALIMETVFELLREAGVRLPMQVGQAISIVGAERLMKETGIRSKIAKKYKATTNSKHSLPVAENLLNREFKADKPKQKMVSNL